MVDDGRPWLLELTKNKEDLVPVRFQHPIAQQFWEALERVNSCKSVYSLYWEQFIPIQNHSQDQHKEMQRLFRLARSRNSLDFLSQLLLDFGIMYLESDVNPREKVDAFNVIITKLEERGLSHSNLAVLCYNNRARANHDARRLSQAKDDYTKCINIDRTFASAYYNRAITFDYQRDYASAIKDYTTAIEFNPMYSRAYNNRGICYNAMKQFDLALVDYTKALEIEPDYVKAWSNRAITYYFKKDYENAIADTKRTLELDPCYCNAHFNQGLCYKLLGQQVLALRSFNSALMLKPQDSYSKVKSTVLYHILDACRDPL